MIGKKFLREKINKVRKRVIEESYKANVHHIGTCLSSIEILCTLFFKILKKNDRFILSKGHAAVAFYVIKSEMGLLKKININKLEQHPLKDLKKGIYCSTGSLGQGLSVGCGLALGDRKHDIYVLVGDGECEEGSVWETARFANEFNLKNLKVIVDANGYALWKKTDRKKLANKWKAFGWNVKQYYQHDWKNFKFDCKTKKPIAFIVYSKKGSGIDFLENKMESHWKKLNQLEYEKAIRQLSH